MKRFCLILIAFVITSDLRAQATYPLQVGNLWQYWTYDYLNGQTTWIYGWTTRVVGDTLMPDGKTYARLKSDGGYGLNGFARQENSKVITYATGPYGTNVLYDFSKSPYDTMFVFPRSVQKDSIIQVVLRLENVSVYGLIKLQWTFYLFSTRTSYDRSEFVTDGFGLTTLKQEGGDEWFLRGAIINGTSYGTITNIDRDGEHPVPTAVSLLQNYPNPFNSSTNFTFVSPKASAISLKLFDVLGRELATLAKGNYLEGEHIIRWNASQFPSGIYYYRLQNGNFSETKKLLLIK